MRSYAKEIVLYYPLKMKRIIDRIIRQQEKEMKLLLKEFDGLGKGDAIEIVRKCAREAESIMYKTR